MKNTAEIKLLWLEPKRKEALPIKFDGTGSGLMILVLPDVNADRARGADGYYPWNQSRQTGKTGGYEECRRPNHYYYSRHC